ncbi:MAG: peptide deformylase [bacterium]
MKKMVINRFTSKLKQNNLALRYYPDQVLRKSSSLIHTYDKALQDFAYQMFSFMQASKGIGLAAPQIGILYRIITIDSEGMERFLINPEIIRSSSNKDIEEEGCLSLPDQWYTINRSLEVEVKARSPEGKKLHFTAKGLNARIIQHEIDHLNGILICDKNV